jgi:hypothetical protein
VGGADGTRSQRLAFVEKAIDELRDELGDDAGAEANELRVELAAIAEANRVGDKVAVNRLIDAHRRVRELVTSRRG